MKLIYTDDHREHAGAKEMRYDQMIPMSESPERMDLVCLLYTSPSPRD